MSITDLDTALANVWGRRLAAARTAKELSIRELARRTGIHLSQLARFERGEAGLGDTARYRVAAELGQQVADLFPYPTVKEAKCPSAASAPDGDASPTPATTGETPSPAPSAKAPDGSARSDSPASDSRRSA